MCIPTCHWSLAMLACQIMMGEYQQHCQYSLCVPQQPRQQQQQQHLQQRVCAWALTRLMDVSLWPRRTTMLGTRRASMLPAAHKQADRQEQQAGCQSERATGGLAASTPLLGLSRPCLSQRKEQQQ